jgi:siroheme synthase-like protein
VWLNAADDPAHCTFILPAVVRRGVLTIAVASGGATPALTRALREHLESALGAEWATLAELAAEARRELRAAGRAADGETWRRALASDVRALVADRRVDDARRELRARLAMPV